MPNRPRSPCTFPGCGKLIDIGSRCEQHQVQARRESDATRENSHHRGYTWRWRQYRDTSWLPQHPLCGDRLHGPNQQHSHCLQMGIVTPATDVDHIIAVDGPNDPLFWDQNNHQSLCHSCHSLKTASEGGFGREVGGGSKS